MSDIKFKQYIVVIKPLINGISRAKFGVHCAHACLVASINSDVSTDRFTEWYAGGHLQIKIIKEVTSLKKLKNIVKKAKDLSIPCGMVSDAGFTGELQKGEFIMAAFGPIPEDEAKILGIRRLSNYKG